MNIGRDGPLNGKKAGKLNYGKFGMDHELNIIVVSSLIPYDVFNESKVYGCINKDGEWVRNNDLCIKRENKLEYVALEKDLEAGENWGKHKDTMPFEAYILNQLFEGFKRKKGYFYNFNYRWDQFQEDPRSYKNILSSKRVLNAINSDEKTLNIYTKLMDSIIKDYSDLFDKYSKFRKLSGN